MNTNAKTILVIDDEPALREMIELRARDLGLNVVTAEHGQDALLKLKNDKIHLIICDVLMPVMDGFAFYKEIKKNAAWAGIPVLILTARGKMEDSFKVMGVDDFVAKPFDGKALMEKVMNLLSRQREESAPEPTAVFEPISSPVMPGNGKKVCLACEDQEPIQLMTQVLQKNGCPVEKSLTGRDLVFKASKFVPEVILLDVLISDIEAHKLIKMLKAAPELKTTKIYTFSFYRLENVAGEDIRQLSLTIDLASERCFDEGADEYLGRFNDGIFMQEMMQLISHA